MPRFQPSLDEFRRLSQLGNLVPVYCEVVADGETPVSLYARLGRRPYSFLLESVLGGARWAAYSFLGLEPLATLQIADGSFVWQERGREALSGAATAPVAVLRQFLSRFRAVEVPGLPRFSGGAVGFFSYDVARSTLPLPPARAPSPTGLPDATFVFTDTVAIVDNLRQTLRLVTNVVLEPGAPVDAAYQQACERLDKLLDQLRAPPPQLRPLDPYTERRIVARANESQLSFVEKVRRAKEYILAGDAFQIVLSQRFEVDRPACDDFDLYRALRVVNPSPYMFHLALPEGHITGASPEVLARVEGDTLVVRPIAGTRRRGESATEDAALAAELLADPKERAEHTMLIDLGRNDVGRVAEIGSVRVDEAYAIERYSHVMHMCSEVRGELRLGEDALSAFAACFPAGTLTGAPKLRAMQIIDELEAEPRGLYGGAVGYASYGGNLDMAIAIRTLVGRKDRLYFQAGAGIVADSDPDAEYEETLAKSRALLRAIAMVV